MVRRRRKGGHQKESIIPTSQPVNLFVACFFCQEDEATLIAVGTGLGALAGAAQVPFY